MELTTKQIEYIENRLQKNGLTYWDIRMEILDHLVSEIEVKLSEGEPYDSALENAFDKLHLNKNLDALNQSRVLGVNKIVRKQYFNQVKKFFTSLRTLLFILLFIISYTITFKFASNGVFKYVSLTLLISPLLLGIYFYFRQLLLKQKSAYLLYASFYIFFSILMLNIFIQFANPEGFFSVSRETQKLVFFLVTTINTIFTSAGILVYSKTYKRIKNIVVKYSS